MASVRAGVALEQKQEQSTFENAPAESIAAVRAGVADLGIASGTAKDIRSVFENAPSQSSAAVRFDTKYFFQFCSYISMLKCLIICQ